MNDPSFSCPDCGENDMNASWAPPSYTLSCNACDWSVATSLFRPIDRDEVTYRLQLLRTDRPDPVSIQIIKQYRKIGTQRAIQHIKRQDVFILKGRAKDILKLSLMLRSKGVGFQIDPEFPYGPGALDDATNDPLPN